MISRDDRSHYAVFIAISGVIPFTVMCFCSWKILMALKRSRQRIAENISSMSSRNDEERPVTLILLVIVIALYVSSKY